MTDFDRRPTGSNADEWHLFLSEHLDNRANFPNGLTYVAVQIAEAIDAATPAVGGETVAVPKAALDWLFGAGPDSEGLWFGQGLRDHGSYWWRSKFRAMISAAPPASPLRQDVYCVLRDMWDEDEAPSWPQVEAAIERLLSVPASPLRGRELANLVEAIECELDVDARSLAFRNRLAAAKAALASPPEQPAADPLPSIDQVRQTVADEWGSYVCYRTMVGVRDCDQDKHCRCTDIARAILSTYTLTPQPAAAPEMFRCNCPHEVRSGCSEPQCPHYTPPRTEQHENCNCLMCLAEKPR